MLKAVAKLASPEKKDETPTTDDKADKVDGENKRKLSGDETEDLEEPATKQTKVENVDETA